MGHGDLSQQRFSAHRRPALWFVVSFLSPMESGIVFSGYLHATATSTDLSVGQVIRQIVTGSGSLHHLSLAFPQESMRFYGESSVPSYSWRLWPSLMAGVFQDSK